MPLPNIALAAAPAAVNLAANFLTSPRQTAAERELRGLAQYFKKESERPYFETTEAQAQVSAADRVDKRNRKRTKASGARAGTTGEADIAGTQSANEAHAMNMNRVAGRATGYRQRMLSNYMNALGGAEQSRMSSEQEWQNNIRGITEGVGGVTNNLLVEKFLKKYLE